MNHSLVVEIRGSTTSFRMMNDIVFGLCVNQDGGEWVPLLNLNIESRKAIIGLFKDNNIASQVWKEELSKA